MIALLKMFLSIYLHNEDMLGIINTTNPSTHKDKNKTPESFGRFVDLIELQVG
jgi:hypothetical protein